MYDIKPGASGLWNYFVYATSIWVDPHVVYNVPLSKVALEATNNYPHDNLSVDYYP